MVRIPFPYGKSQIEVNIPVKNLVELLEPQKEKLKSNCGDSEIIKKALNKPFGTPTLPEIVKANDKVVIVVSDKTRPVPVNKILPFILEKISQAGCPKDNIKIIFALGNHHSQTVEEHKKIVGEDIYRDYKCEDFDKKDTVFVGMTTRGTPIWLSKSVYEADKRICIGNIEMHYFAGFTGGYKAILPGVCGTETITHNHSLMKLPNSEMGILEENPVRSDIEEAGKMVGVDFIFNAILNEDKKIVEAVAGHPIIAHRKGCDFAEKLYRVEIKQKVDIVVASAGGYPKDMNLYQAQKALENAAKVLKPNGSIILIAQCPDGPGEGTFKDWMTDSVTLDEVIKRFEEGFVLGGHKAAVIAKILKKHQVFLVSELSKENTEKYFFDYASSVDSVLEGLISKYTNKPSVIAMPYAHLTVPSLKEAISAL